MPKRHAPSPPQFRAEAIRLVRTSGKPMREIARQLEVTSATLRLWMKQADIDDGVRHDGPTTEETEAGRRLRREIKTLREEREIPGKAAACFAKETGQVRERGCCSWSESRRIIRWPCGVVCWRSPPAATTPGAGGGHRPVPGRMWC
jgi:transposase